MSANATEIQALLDRDKIRNCISQLARGEDRRNPELIRASYWPDSLTDYGVFKGTFDEYFAWVIPGSDAILVTHHFLGQSFIDLHATEASVETLVSSYHRIDLGHEQRDTTVAGRYLDRMEKRDGEWRIANRTMLYDYFTDGGIAVNWAQGVMGLPFSADHYTGRAKGDYSEVFFSGAQVRA